MRLAWEVQGDGAPLLLVHGTGYTRQGWGPVRERLALRYCVVSFDNRGIGESEIPPGPYSVDLLAGDVEQVLDEAGLDRAHVLGTSLGGFVAQAFAAAHPERVDRLVLACTSPGGAAAYPFPQQTLRLMAEAPTLEPEVALRRFVENALAPDAPQALVDEIMAYRRTYPPDPVGWAAQAAAAGTWDADGRLARISAPTLVVTGTADTVVDPRNSELLAAQVSGAQLAFLPGAGHLLFWERPDDFAGIVEQFLG